jgi:hypothetical protein
MFIDDANTRRIPSWTRVDAQVSRSVGAIAINVGARNLSTSRSTEPVFRPTGSGEAYFYPAADACSPRIDRPLSVSANSGRLPTFFMLLFVRQ